MRTLFPTVEHEINADSFLALNGERRYDDVLREYKAHEWGIFHGQQDPRYSQKYGYDHGQMLTDFGDDVHPVEHMVYTEAKVGQPLLRSMYASGTILQPNDAHLLRLSFGTHDTGECSHEDFAGIATGDVAYSEKTPEDEEKEKKVRERIYDEVLWFIPEKQLEIVESIIAYEHELSPKLELAERWGYHITGVQAGRLALYALDQDDDSHVTTQQARMGYEVTNRHVDWLSKQRGEAEIINRWLINSAGIQDRINTELASFCK